MTTTHTFQGLNADNKPSSRVLNPPGGSSSNIFGSDSQVKQNSYARNTSDSVSREKNEKVGQVPSAATTGPQQKSRAPRSGFNPITGEPYGQPEPKSEPRNTEDQASSENTAINTCADEAVQASAETSSTLVIEKSQPETAQTSESAIVAGAPAEEKQQPQPTQSGQLFGDGTVKAKEHTSTRVSQPPGGRSSKLW